jgi:hypothetical protein
MDDNNFMRIYYSDFISEKYIKLINKFLTFKSVCIVPSYLQTKDWRKKQKWYINGKHNECETYQKSLLLNIITKSNIKELYFKTYERINLENYEITIMKNPLNENNGLEYTEDFDAKILLKNNNLLYINLKFICDKGGMQTRSLREVYHFVKAQLEYLKKKNNDKIYFINICDGDTCFDFRQYFAYLINNKKNCYFFDMHDFRLWFNHNFI